MTLSKVGLHKQVTRPTMTEKTAITYLRLVRSIILERKGKEGKVRGKQEESKRKARGKQEESNRIAGENMGKARG